MRTFIILFTLAMCSIAGHAQKPVEDFANLPFMQSPQLSPSGEKYATLIAVDGKPFFLIKHATDKNAPSPTISLREYDLTSWQWVNEDWLVATISTEQPIAGSKWRISRTLAIKADGKEIKTLRAKEAGQNASDILWVASDGSPHIILSYQTSIYTDDTGFWPRVDLIDVSRDKVVETLVVPRDNVQSWYADAEGNVRMGISRRDSSLKTKLHYRDSNDQVFKVVDRASRKENESITVPTMFLPDKNQALVFDNSEGYDAIRKFDIKNFEMGEEVFSVEGYDVSSIRTNAAGDKMAGVTWIDTKRRYKWFDPDMATLHANLDESTPGQSVRLISSNKARTRFILHIGNASRPGAYYIFDKGWGVLHRLAHVNEKLPAKAYAPVKTVRYKARDGLEIEAVMTLPKGKEAKDLPLIMLPHGGPHARDYERWDWQAQYLADRGYAVIQPNFRGSSGYGNRFSALGQKEWGLAMQNDLDDGVSYMVSQGFADKDRVCIMGGSYGGYAAMRAAHRNSDIYKCAISFAGVSDLPAMLRYDKGFLNGKFSNAYFEDQIDDLDIVSPINFADDFDVPILLVHGKLDKRVELSQSKKLAKKLEKAGKNVRYIEQKEGDHHFSLQADRVEFLTEVETFLNTYNPAD